MPMTVSFPYPPPPPPPTHRDRGKKENQRGDGAVMVPHPHAGERTASPVGQQRGFASRLRLFSLGLAQGAFPLVSGTAATTAMLKASAVILGMLLTSQAALAQSAPSAPSGNRSVLWRRQDYARMEFSE